MEELEEEHEKAAGAGAVAVVVARWRLGGSQVARDCHCLCQADNYILPDGFRYADMRRNVM